MRTSLPLTLLDQAILSAFSVGTNLLLLSVAAPEAFGQFAYTLAVVLVFTSLQNALICTPIAVYLPASEGRRRAHLLGAFWRVDMVMRLVACALALPVFVSVDSDAVYLAVASLLLVSAMWRETARSTLFASSEFGRCLALDGLAVALGIVAALQFWSFVDPMLAILGGMALGNAVAVLVLARRPAFRDTTAAAAVRAYLRYWPELRWSAVGSATTEAQYRLYVFALEWTRGLQVLGNVQAGRVLVGPLTLAVVAWGRVARSAMARAIAGNETGAATTMLRNGLGLLALAVAAYGVALLTAWPLVEGIVFRGRYPEIGVLTACWFVYAVVNATETAISVYVQAARGFRGLAFSTIAAAAVSLVLLCGLVLDVRPLYAIAAVTAGEVVALCWTSMLAIRIAVAARRSSVLETEAAR